MVNARKLRILLTLTAMLVFGVVLLPGKDVQAKKKVNDCTITAVGKLVWGYSDYSGQTFTKIKFSGNKVTLKGKFKVKINGKKKMVKQLTLKVSKNCKYAVYEYPDEQSVGKSEMQKSLKKCEFIKLKVKIRNGKVTKFVTSA